jgi:hypothetical protein
MKVLKSDEPRHCVTAAVGGQVTVLMAAAHVAVLVPSQHNTADRHCPVEAACKVCL